MKTKIDHPNALSNRRFLISVSLCMAGIILAVFASTGFSKAVGRSTGRKSGAVVLRSATTAREIPAGNPNFWMQTNGPQGGDGIALARNSMGDLFLGTPGGGIFRSTDNAETWSGI